MKFSTCGLTAAVASHSVLVGGAVLFRGALRSVSLVGGLKFGSDECPCIGFDGIEGETPVTIDSKEITFPADLGASCKAWDESSHPECRAKEAPGWCTSAWCYVDARNCHIKELPKMAPLETAYQPKAMYQNMPLHFSYATCEAKDTWSKGVANIGLPGCRCIGFDNADGVYFAKLLGKDVGFPAEIGGECKAWDEGVNPECKGDKPPAWCAQKYCYVDPCSCDLDVAPKVTVYFPTGNFQGRPLFYSYATCGEKDAFSTEAQVEAGKKKIGEVCGGELKEKYGEDDCPCIGFDGIEGDTPVNVSNEVVKYPSDLGGSCKAWDESLHPKCNGEGAPSWCAEKWCYVDPKHCSIAVTPKTAPPETAYQPKATYQNLPLYYSYSTCGGKDTWAAEQPDVGPHGCRCIGFDNAEGHNLVKINDTDVEFPAEIGGECKAWDDSRHPECKGDKAPTWCAQKWCFVDPCSCDLDVTPKKTVYFPSATFQGRPIFYSYAACGQKDAYSSEEQVSSGKKKIEELCGKDKSHSQPTPYDLDAPSDQKYNHSRFEDEWHSEWKHGEYPKWKGAKL